jgi:short-subunit dehydrogenase
MLPGLNNVLITGASSGIGAALARHYAAPSVALALTGRDAGRLAATAETCRVRGAIVEAATVDVTDRDGLRAWIERIDDARSLGLVVANAGVSAAKGGDGEAAMRRVFATNVEGVLNTVLPVMPRMAARGAGQIALMSSLAAFRGWPGSASYGASKAAVMALGEAWRLELESSGVRVSVICPGFVATSMTARNKFKMPFLMSAERAAQLIARGLARDKSRIAFPLPMTALCWLAGALPAGMSDGLIRRLDVVVDAGPHEQMWR